MITQAVKEFSASLNPKVLPYSLMGLILKPIFKINFNIIVPQKGASSSSFPFPFVPLQRRGCLVAPLFL
jgi:hypothetical protein